jgi:dTDP-4-amino-4,6-dideoxy-D-galactose acyltransferase
MSRPDWNPLSFLQRHFPEIILPFPANEPAVSLRALPWDSEFFGADMFKIDFIAEKADPTLLTQALPPAQSGKRCHVMAEVPTEASASIQALCRAGFSMVETRLNYFHLLENIPPSVRSCRPALENDIPFIRRTASEARNEHDRYHSDPFFSEEMASSYLETYAENCIRGLAETVFVPELPSEPASFAALSKLSVSSLRQEFSLYRIPLTACLPENKGWHYHLCLAALSEAKYRQGNGLVMTTQAGNKAVIHNCEKLGFRLGSTFHIFSKEL